MLAHAVLFLRVRILLISFTLEVLGLCVWLEKEEENDTAQPACVACLWPHKPHF